MKTCLFEWDEKLLGNGSPCLMNCDLNRLPICLKGKSGCPGQDLLSIYKNGVWVLLGLLALHHLPRRISTYLPVDLTGLLGFKGQNLGKRTRYLKVNLWWKDKENKMKSKLEWKVNEKFGVVPNERPSVKDFYRRACLSDLDLLF